MFRVNIISALSDAIFTIIEGLLALRLLLKFFGANPTTPFVIWIYQTSQPLLKPFEGIFPTTITHQGFVIEVSALFALLVYAFVGYLVQEVLMRLQVARKK